MKLILVKLLISAFLFQYSDIYPQVATPKNESEKPANYWHQYGKKLRKQAKYDSAITAFTRASELFEATDSTEQYVNALNLTGRCYQQKLDHAASLPYLHKALKAGQNNLSKNHPERALSHNFLGIAYRYLYKYPKALMHYKEALVIRRSYFGKHHSRTISVLRNIAHLYKAWDYYDEALHYYFQAVSDSVKISGFQRARSYNDIGNTFLDKGDFINGEIYYKKALSLLSAENARDLSLIYKLYFNMGRSFTYQSDYETALYYYQNYQNAPPSVKKKPQDILIALNNIATLYLKLKRYEDALQTYNKALKLQKEIEPNNYLNMERLYNNLGYLHFLTQDWQKSLAYYDQSLSYIALLEDQNLKQFMESYERIALIHTELEQYSKAIFYIEKGLSIGTKVFHERHPHLVRFYINYGNIHFLQKSYQQALEHYQKALCSVSKNCDESKIQNLPKPEDSLEDYQLLTVLSAKMNVFWAISQQEQHVEKRHFYLKSILSHYNLANQLVHKIRTGFKSENSKFLLAGEVYRVIDIALTAAYRLYEETRKDIYLATAFRINELGKSMTLADAFAELNAQAFGAIPENLLKKERALKIDLTAYENRVEKLQAKSDAAGQSLLDSLSGRYASLQVEYNELLASFENDYPAYYDLKYSPRQINLADVRNALGKDAAMIEYFVGKKAVRMLLITEKEFLIKSFPNDSAFQQLLSGFNKSIRKDTESRHFAGRSAAIYDKLIRPIISEITEKKRLIIIPDGELHYLPFEALIKSMPENEIEFSQMAYLLHDFEISYHYSANLYLHSAGTGIPKYVKNAGVCAPVFKPGDNTGEIHESGGSLLAQAKETAEKWFDNIVRSGDTHFRELPASETEAQGILDALDWDAKKNHSYMRRKATEENFKLDVHKYKFVHLATHSFVNEAQPKLSGIAFAQPEDSSVIEDGILYASEIYNLDINADLVTLSSCESGVGKLVRGEGLMAMTRGFLYAGAANVVVSLWKVPDKPTSELMIEFYKHIADKKPYVTALRAAKLKLIQDPRLAFPASWSSFILIGR